MGKVTTVKSVAGRSKPSPPIQKAQYILLSQHYKKVSKVPFTFPLTHDMNRSKHPPPLILAKSHNRIFYNMCTFYFTIQIIHLHSNKFGFLASLCGAWSHGFSCIFQALGSRSKHLSGHFLA